MVKKTCERPGVPKDQMILFEEVIYNINDCDVFVCLLRLKMFYPLSLHSELWGMLEKYTF